MARYRVQLYGRREVETAVIVDAADEDEAQLKAEYLVACDPQGVDLDWEEASYQSGLTNVASDDVDEVDPGEYQGVTTVFYERPGNPYWQQMFSPASATHRAWLRR